MLKLLAKSANNQEVLYDPVGSHVATHFDDTPGLKSLVQELIASINLGGEVARHFDMGRVIGLCDVVSVGPQDDLVYGMRRNREEDGLVPFVKNREGEPTQNLAIHIILKSPHGYVLSSAWIGTFGDDEPFPQSPEATPGSIEYWSQHAFIYGSQEIIEGTETTAKPW